MTAPPPLDSRQSRPVARRHVFYIAGFDPRGVRHYHGLYRDEARLQAAVGGYDLAVGSRRAASEHGVAWDVTGRFDGAEVRSVVEFLAWDDIVRARWPRTGFATCGAVLSSYAYMLFRGVVARMLAASWPFVITMSLGFLAVFAALAASFSLGFAVIAGIGAPIWLALAGGIGAAVAAASQMQRLDPRTNALWLGRTLAFVVDQANGRTPDFEARQQAFAARIAEVLAAGEADEVLVVGHSVGAPTAIGVVARLLSLRPLADGGGPRLALLTLGSTAPMLAFCPHAASFRAEVAAVAAAANLDWIDVSAPPDPACFPLVDPVVAAGARPGPDPKGRPKLVSPRFHDIIAPDLFRRMCRDRMRLHFQYLMAAQRPGLYDYFAITAGPVALAGRFAGVRSQTGFRRLALLP